MTGAIDYANRADLHRIRSDLDRIGGPGRSRAQRNLKSQPLWSSESLRREGFGGALVDDLQNTGANRS